MSIKNFLITVFVSLFLFSCSEDNDVTVPRNLKDYLSTISDNDFGEVIACAASASGNTNITYIFYYPETGAKDIRYYEANDLTVDKNDFSLYKRKNYNIDDVFGGKIQRFTRNSSTESWGLVTYILNGKLHKSNPIRLKNTSKPTGWTNQVTIEYPNALTPKFLWSDFGVTDNAIYFQVISEKEEDKFISGTYTYDKFFQYFDTSNVVLNINVPETPEDLKIDTEYVFTMMAVSEDNWVNFVIQEDFVTQNLEEYLSENVAKTKENTIAFAASSKSSQNLVYVYYYPLVGASDYRYFETENALVDKNDFSNYRRRNLSDEALYGGKLRRYSRSNAAERWCIISYIIDDKLYKSEPIRIKNTSKPTEWLSELTVEFTESLKPKFSWNDGAILENQQYFQVISKGSNVFVSGTFTTDKYFQFYDTSNVTSNINLDTPVDLVLGDEYNFTLMGLSSDNWVNLIIQKSFTVE